VSFITKLEDRSEKALYRGGLALYGLQRFDEAAEVLRVLETKFPESAAGKHELARTFLRIKEHKTGVYDRKSCTWLPNFDHQK
jgi:hypothetical protein